jgi:hypothetical protein
MVFLPPKRSQWTAAGFGKEKALWAKTNANRVINDVLMRAPFDGSCPIIAFSGRAIIPKLLE